MWNDVIIAYRAIPYKKVNKNNHCKNKDYNGMAINQQM